MPSNPRTGPSDSPAWLTPLKRRCALPAGRLPAPVAADRRRYPEGFEPAVRKPLSVPEISEAPLPDLLCPVRNTIQLLPEIPAQRFSFSSRILMTPASAPRLVLRLCRRPGFPARRPAVESPGSRPLQASREGSSDRANRRFAMLTRLAAASMYTRAASRSTSESPRWTVWIPTLTSTRPRRTRLRTSC
jgi:hypothetical protein